MPSVHIGSIIKKVAKKNRLSTAALAKMINRTRQAVQAMYNREGVNSADLEKLSEVLEYNFFQHYINENLPKVEEPYIPNYGNVTPKKKSISIVVELDGSDECIKKNISILSEINSVVRKQAS